MPGKLNVEKLTESVKEVAKRQGAVLVGVAPVERFDPMPPLYDAVPGGHHPKNFVPEARSVISVAMPILNPVMEAPAFLVDKERNARCNVVVSLARAVAMHCLDVTAGESLQRMKIRGESRYAFLLLAYGVDDEGLYGCGHGVLRSVRVECAG